LNWETLFTMQHKLDTYIEQTHQVDGKELFEEKILSLLVELGECANETRSFKFWSTKESSSKEVISEEFVDNIHFLLSIGLDKGYTFQKINFVPSNRTITKQFNDVFSHCLNFYHDQSELNYMNLFKSYLQLGELLGFSEQDILNAYVKKNKVNFERQAQGY